MADEANGENPAGGDGTAENKSGTQTDATSNKSAATNDKKETTDGEGGEPEIRMTQKQFDEMIEKRLKRERQKAADDAKLSETDRLKKELAEKDQAIRDRDNRDTFLGKLGVSGEVGQRIYRAFKEDLDVDDKGKITNLDAVVKDAKAAFPQVFAEQKPKGGGDGGKGNGGSGGGGGDMNALIRRGR